MKILLLQSPLGVDSRDCYPVYPLGIAYIATALAASGHDVQAMDPNVLSDPYADIASRIDTFAPDIIGLSLRNIDNQARLHLYYFYKHFKEMATFLTERKKDALLVAGGAGFSMFGKRIMEQNPGIDLGLHLEAEESFPEVLTNLGRPQDVKGVYYRENGGVHFSGDRPMPDFGALPIPRRDFLDMTPYLGFEQTIGVQTKRGCRLRCAYCNYPFLNGRQWRLRTPEHICDELEYLKRDFNVKTIVFADSVVNVPYDYSTAILEEMVRRDIGMKWSAYTHIKGITKEYLQLMKRSGCTGVCYSPDGISEAALKGLQKDITPADIENAYNLAVNEPTLADMDFTFCFFINPPGETLAGLLQTIAFYFKAKKTLRKRGGGAFMNWLRIEPHTALYDLALREGVITPQTDMLPEHTEGLRDSIYVNPATQKYDLLPIAILKAVPLAKAIVKKVLGKKDAPTCPVDTTPTQH
ncbi:B12-binding domain-containing radical SAM protein [Desulfovibrio inopinatus]|uniref:B12-binding domain-containing radical SAM protein n=1 Tax=Desulfovibrio inopinatus TaxID=102109 RepID=UPI00040F305D|nr:B12-binding domain-containing radical SAM protein [Desulfovibrio inopinatus]